jgi:hypothetical protein
MQIKGSLTKGVLVALGIALIPITAAAAENATPLTACKVLNQKVVNQNKTFTCVKSGKKLVWNKGVVVVKPLPTSAAQSAPLSAPTPAPEPTVTSPATSSFETPAPTSTCSRNKNALKNC